MRYQVVLFLPIVENAALIRHLHFDSASVPTEQSPVTDSEVGTLSYKNATVNNRWKEHLIWYEGAMRDGYLIDWLRGRRGS